MKPAASVVLIFITVLIQSAQSYRILALLPIHIKSHFLTFEPLLKGLREKGHEVTVVSHFPQKTPLPNYKDVSLEGTAQIMLSKIDMNDFTGRRYEKYFSFLMLAEFAQASCESLSSKPLQQFLKTQQEYDVIITEMFTSHCMLGVVDKYPAPIVGLSSCAIMPWTNALLGNPDNPSYIPNILLDNNSDMTFFRRVENTVVNVLCILFDMFLLNKVGDAVSQKYLGPNATNLERHANNLSLLLLNTHSTIHGARPYVPNIIEVGGLHIAKAKQLPKNIEKWISESVQGVIYFSLGSMIKGHTFPEEKRQMFMRAFGRLPQRVLWKWENDTMPGKSDNIMTQKWMPQFDILCHPNVKAFISHGGLLGTTEAVHCGVPMIIMPQYGDQHTNAKAVEASGGGVILQYTELTEENIYNALKTVLSPSFNKQAKELSARFRDRPLPPLDTAIYWVEYVARHKGAPHMRSAATKLTWYQYLLLDVIAFLIFVLLSATTISYYITRAICRKLFCKAAKVKTN